MAPARARLAPSPTGDLHLGGASTFLVAWLEARAGGGALALRIEDLDAPRVVAGAEAGLLSDLAFLGLDWDEGPDRPGPFAPYRQSERAGRYESALASLSARGLTYLCDCSRAEIARVASAPHAGDEGPRYPGTCRMLGMASRAFRRPPAVRFRVPEGAWASFVDGVHGERSERPAEASGDFVLRRGDGVFAYHLAVVVDDIAMQIGQVVRGADLLGVTARQILLYQALGEAPPGYLHAPLVLGPEGERLAKRSGGVPVREQRARGRSGAEILGPLAFAIGAAPDPRPRTPQELLAVYRREGLLRGPVRAPRALVGPQR